jgi:hypothetical protein
MQIPSATSGNFSAVTDAVPKRHKVTIDRTCMILRTLDETSWVLSTSSQINQMYVAFTRKKTAA